MISRKMLFQLIEYLGLQKPVDIRLTTRAHSAQDGYYLPNYGDDGELKSHRITLYLGQGKMSRPVRALFAHELIHAWQEENDAAETHGQHFQRLARLIEADFGIKKIYLPELDN